MTVYVVIPAHNEAANISPVIESIRQQLSSASLNFVIMLVDDGSNDETVSLVLGLSHQEQIQIVRNSRRLGVAQTFQRGLQRAVELSVTEDDLLLIMEADGTSDPMLIRGMVSALNSHEIVIASRFIRGGGMRGFSYLRAACSKFVNQLLRIFIPLYSVTDYTIFYRGYRLSLIKKAFTDYNGFLFSFRGFEANTELLFILSRYNVKIKEIPLVYDYSLRKSKSKMPVIRTIYNYIVLMVKTKMCH